jgi:uncharacterized membrane protein YkvA (DUF1232 family)
VQVSVFISHQWRDKQLADRMKQQIEQLTTADVWIDYRNLRPGDPIQESIDGVLADIDVVLVLWTQHSAASSNVAKEIDTATRLGKRVIPLITEYDDGGDPLPPLAGAAAGFLGIDFHHFDSGVVTLTSLLLDLQNEKAELGMEDDPRMRLIRRVQQAAGYLANYRAAKGVDDDRGYWVDQIVLEIERYVDETGDHDTAATIVGALDSLAESDPEAHQVAMVRLERFAAPAPESAVVEPSEESFDAAPLWQPPAAEPAGDMLDQQLALVSGGQDIGALRAAVDQYLSAATPASDAMANVAVAVQSPAGMQVAQYLRAYLVEADDLIPDRYGAYGYLDDAWLILNTAFRLIESGALTVQQIPLDWQSIIAADPIVRALIPAQAMVALEQQLMQILNLIAAEINSYQPWMTPDGSGYSPTIAGGGSWEDQMNTALLGTGLSV